MASTNRPGSRIRRRDMEWEVVIGLEVHVQLATQSKIFSGASTAFGADPNTQACAVDLAMPGTLPVPNEEAFRFAVMFGLAMNAEIGKRSVFERKNYFYPDLPKGYQTTQLEQPIVGEGQIEIHLEDGSSKTVRLHHAHLEEDAGKSLHEDFHGMSGIDLNRAGTPLIEIVSEPDMRSAAEAVAYLKKIHSIVTYLGISDGDMSQGSLRCDANVSVRLKGEEELGTRTEIKNLNSFRFIEKAIKVEAQRQIDLIEDGGKVAQETRLYDADKNETRSMRSKEVANDYRYFPCPDLLPVVLSDEYVEQIRGDLPELPDAKCARFEKEYGLSAYDADQLTQERPTANYFEQVAAKSGEAKLAANWVMGELAALLNREEKSIEQSPVNAEHLAGLIARIKDGTISSKIAKQVFEAMANGDGDADAVIEAKGLKQVSDTGAIEKLVDDVIAASTAQVENYRNADPDKRPKMMGFFVGQIMKASKGQANPQMINKILKEKLDALL
ncbi:Asp-tRNA(Asn)/Glu-tRNA(Gln) amidotransferase subunit GatB [Microbulbifer agarilyticus]|nr:Asp-tRNA(Asn)/Glu-tRNA(Gln) amidotransferase subunit GatB [Microbulbifer agarilyticus]